jgi:hypothetical protein
VIVTAYGDESGTHNGPDGSPIMMLAGYVSTLGQWNYFDPHWKAAVLNAGLPGYFHATEHWDTTAGRRFASQADRFLARYIQFGYVIELDKESYGKYYIAGNRPRKPQLDTRYSICFRYLVAWLLTALPTLLGRGDITLNFVLEEGAAGSDDSHRIIRQLRKQPETQEIAKMLAPAALSFGQKKKFPGLQASDALSFVTLKIAPTNPEMIDLPQHAPLAHSFEPVFRREAARICSAFRKNGVKSKEFGLHPIQRTNVGEMASFVEQSFC